MKKQYLIIGSIGVLVLALIGVLIYWFWSRQQASDSTSPTPTASSPTATPDPNDIKPQLLYDGAYNGPLFAASEKIGTSAPLNVFFAGMDRNGVYKFVAYFNYEPPSLINEEDDEGDDEGDDIPDEKTYIQQALAKGKNRIVAFYSPGLGGEGSRPYVGNTLTNMYKVGYADLEQAFPGTLQGIGEVEVYAWRMPHDDPRIKQLFTFATEKKLHVMFHPLPGTTKQVEQILKAYPNTFFVIHMFHNDFAQDSTAIIDLLRRYPNLYYTIDADHLLFDQQAKIGLLYKYQDTSVQNGVTRFGQDYARLSASMMTQAVSQYGPMVQAVPDKIVWGTEMHNRYTYEPAVYDRVIEFSRRFIGTFTPEIQEKIAYRNAERIFAK